MARKTLNLGILAHVDAGKTTLTERLLYAARVIDTVGSVDEGTTQTDSLALERQRGITIKAAVASFAIGGVNVNLIDTPGHPDFIAEVERVLGVLDGALLVVSGVEGVQPQTRLLMRALQRLGVPTLILVNKIDRTGADVERVLAAISKRLTPSIVPLGRVRGVGTPAAQFVPSAPWDAEFVDRLAARLAESDETTLAAYLGSGATPTYRRLRKQLAAQTHRAVVHPVFFGSALTGAGVDSLMAGIAELLPVADGDAEGPVSGSVFKIDRGLAGEKIAYVRMFSGTVRVRDSLGVGAEAIDKVSAVSVFDCGALRPTDRLGAGEIGKLWGLKRVRIGDALVAQRRYEGYPGATPARQSAANASTQHFAPPTLATVVVPDQPEDRIRLHTALVQLAEQDPLIGVRQDDARSEISVSLYGEVQKEVIQTTLATDYGIGVSFREVTPIYVERPIGTGEAVEILHGESNPFAATVGLRVERAVEDSGVEFRLEIDTRTIPLYIYKTLANFTEHIERYVRLTMQEGLFGWQVTDCLVTMTRCAYSVADGPPSRRGPTSTPADFRHITPLVLMQAIQQAGTVVCEPMLRVGLEIPADSVRTTTSALARAGAVVHSSSLLGDLSSIEATLPAARTAELQTLLPEITSGEGVLETRFAGYRPVAGRPPECRRLTVDPLNRQEYLAGVGRRPV
ncbi:MAG: GTP-binding protein [Acidimicrobiales bacterium]